MGEYLESLPGERAVRATIVIAVMGFVLNFLTSRPFDPGAPRVTAAVDVLRRARHRILFGEETT